MGEGGSGRNLFYLLTTFHLFILENSKHIPRKQHDTTCHQQQVGELFAQELSTADKDQLLPVKEPEPI